MSTPRTIRLSPDDNVVIAIDLVNQGTSAAGLTARERILRGHKMAAEPIREGERVTGFADDCLVRLDVQGKRIEPVAALPRCRFVFSGRDLYFMRESDDPKAAHLFRIRGVAPAVGGPGAEPV